MKNEESLVQKCMQWGVSEHFLRTDKLAQQWMDFKDSTDEPDTEVMVQAFLDMKLDTYEENNPPCKDMVQGWITTIRRLEPDSAWRWSKIFIRGYAKHLESLKKRVELTTPCYPDQIFPVIEALCLRNTRNHVKCKARALGLLISTIRGSRSHEIAQINLSSVTLAHGILNLSPTGRKGVSSATQCIRLHVEAFSVPKLAKFCPVSLYQQLISLVTRNNNLKLGTGTTTPDKAKDRCHVIDTEINRLRKRGKDIASFRPHGLRVGIAHLLMALGRSDKEIMEFIGWQADESLTRYLAGIDRSTLQSDLASIIEINRAMPIQRALQEVFQLYDDPKGMEMFRKWRYLCGNGDEFSPQTPTRLRSCVQAGRQKSEHEDIKKPKSTARSIVEKTAGKLKTSGARRHIIKTFKIKNVKRKARLVR